MASQGFVENEPITLNEEKRSVDLVNADMTELASKKSPTVIDVLLDTVTRQLSVNDIELGEGQTVEHVQTWNNPLVLSYSYIQLTTLCCALYDVSRGGIPRQSSPAS
ncbi:hypothetical protein V1508DRAFT_446379 [Lipomyces doorenjongii]|uniref:uncharacterized protein n=1 Tax=Lipomyces doorenjongii TaxID=383834 RepID=UPI0034CFA384